MGYVLSDIGRKILLLGALYSKNRVTTMGQIRRMKSIEKKSDGTHHITFEACVERPSENYGMLLFGPPDSILFKYV